MKLTYKFDKGRDLDTEYHFTVDDEGTARICFMGSELVRKSISDWLYNLAFWRLFHFDEDGLYSVHWGLYKKWLKVRRRIYKHIDDNADIIQRIELTGYSQGAAIAAFCHKWLQRFEYCVIPTKTIIAGSPKLFGLIGWKKQNQKYFKNMVSLIYKNDIVTKLPPFSKHVGNLIIQEKRDLRISIKDHFLPNYNLMIQLPELQKQGE
jgi:hypothetical protein